MAGWLPLIATLAMLSSAPGVSAQTVVARGLLLNNSSNSAIADVLWGGGLLLRGPIMKSPALLRIGVDRAIGSTTKSCWTISLPYCGPAPVRSRAAAWIGTAGVSIPLVGDPDKTRTSLSVIGDLHAGELHLRLRDTGDVNSSVYETVFGGSFGLSGAWRPSPDSPINLEVDLMIGRLGRSPASGETHGYSPEGFNFRRFNLGLAWRR